MTELFRDVRRICPACPDEVTLSSRGSGFQCQGCEGVFVDGRELAAMMEHMGAAPPPAKARGPVEPVQRRCPLCRTVMQNTTLWSVRVERCETHGTWFDRKELGRTLELAGGGLGPGSAWHRFWGELFAPGGGHGN